MPRDGRHCAQHRGEPLKRLSLRATLFLSLGALVFATLIYLFTRQGLRLHAWTGASAWPALSHAPAWVRYNLPDGLWQFSFCLTIFHVWRDAPRSMERTLMLALPLLLGLGTEVLQALDWLEGVFDAKDLAFEAGFGLFAAVLALGPILRRSPSLAPPILPSKPRALRRGLSALFRAR